MRTRAVAFAALVAAVGCSAPLHPKDFEIPQQSIPAFTGVQPVAVRALLTGAAKRTLPLAGPNIVVSDDEFTAALTARLIATLEKQSVRVDPGAARSIEIQVVRLSLQPQANIDCVIDFNRRLGDGRVRGLQSRSESWNFEKACAAALSEATMAALNDPEMRSYLNGE